MVNGLPRSWSGAQADKSRHNDVAAASHWTGGSLLDGEGVFEALHACF